MLRRGCGLLALVMGMALTAHGAAAQTLGQKLSTDEIARLGALPEYEVDGIRLRVMPGVPEGGEGTWVLNAQGVVGISRHEVMVTGVPQADLQARLGTLLPQPLSQQHFAPTGISVLRFADFDQAVQGYRALRDALPEATVRLSVTFGRRLPR